MKKLLSIAAFALLAGCSTQTTTVGDMTGATKYSQNSHFFLGGIAQEETIYPGKICGSNDKVAATQSKQTFVNGLLTAITLGIYAPHEYSVYCK